MIKDIYKIRKQAPEGATHYEIDGAQVYYYRLTLEILDNKKRWNKKPLEWMSDIKPL